MRTAKLFKYRGSQAVLLPKAFRFSGTEVLVERRGEVVMLRPKLLPKFKTLADVARPANSAMNNNQSTGRQGPDIA
ncbi:MAG TPA: hypothetical protein VGL42_11635 [Opitutaceae bacterium]|jgi:antitoxin VapB